MPMHLFMFRCAQKVFPGSMWQVMAINGRNFYRSKGATSMVSEVKAVFRNVCKRV